MVQFNVSFNIPDSTSLGLLSASEQQAVLDTVRAAAEVWSWYLAPVNVTLELGVTVRNSLFSGSVLAIGGPTDFYPTGSSDDGVPVWDTGPGVELKTGFDPNGSAFDLEIGLTTNVIKNTYYFRPSVTATTDPVAIPSNKIDAFSVMEHEIGHGLGFLSFSDSLSDPEFNNNRSIYDSFIENEGFVGPHAGTQPLQDDSLSHLRDEGANDDLMSPFLSRGTQSRVSATDMLILEDIGLPVRHPTAGNDVIHDLNWGGGALNLGAGNDIGYAFWEGGGVVGGSDLYGGDGDDQLWGSTVWDQLFGDAGNDQIFGREGNDTLAGGDGDDLLQGAAGDDTLDGNDGLDTASFSGPLSAYAIARGVTTIVSGPSGTDALSNVEKLIFDDRTVNLFDSSRDFNGDDRGDVVFQVTDGRAALWEMNGLVPVYGAVVGPNPGAASHVKDSADFNGDGYADILWQTDAGQASIWLMHGVYPIVGDLAGPNPGASWHAIGGGDFDGDGRSDILWQTNTGQAAVWLMNGTTVIGGNLVGPNLGPNWHVKGAGDFNGDSKADIVWQTDSGQVAIWLMNGLTLAYGNTSGPNPGPSWHIKGIGDFNGDFKDDLVFQLDDGRAAIWLMDATNPIYGDLLGPNPGTSWHIKDAVDLNGDGKADILWQTDTGQVAAWLMDGANILFGNSFGPNPGASWHVMDGTAS